MIKIRSHILFKITAFKSEVKASLFRFQKAKAALARVVTNEEHSNVNLKYFKYYQDHIIVIIIILLSHYIKVIILLYRVGYYKHGVYYFGVG